MRAIEWPRPRKNPEIAEAAIEASSGERAALARVLESRLFAKAPVLSAFLTYVCEGSLSEDGPRVTEQEIGVRVFRRPEGYDTGEDNIVRNYARQLRRRLEAYYQDEGRKELLRIEIRRVAMWRPSARSWLSLCPSQNP